ncbi:MAG: hypothetical protein ACI8VL_001825 [Bacteroidia bacterium]|jgi:hypothetical protein
MKALSNWELENVLRDFTARFENGGLDFYKTIKAPLTVSLSVFF